MTWPVRQALPHWAAASRMRLHYRLIGSRSPFEALPINSVNQTSVNLTYTRRRPQRFWSASPVVGCHTLPIIRAKRRGWEVGAVVEIHFRVIGPGVTRGHRLW